MTEALETQKFHFHFTEDMVNQLNWQEFEALERAQEGDVKMYLIRPLLARFMVTESGQTIPFNLAMNQLGALPLANVTQVIQTFFESLKEKVVPKGNGNSLSSPARPATPVTSESPDGITP